MRDNRSVELEPLGWDDGWDAAFASLREDGLLPGRVAAQHRGAYDVLTAAGESRASISPRLRRGSTPVELPVVGDWVGLDAAGVVHSVLPRRTAFSRRAPRASATEAAREQVIAANVDVIFVVASFDQELDRLQLERYVALTLQSGARPVILLTKADLEPSPAAIVDELAGIGDELPVHAISVRDVGGARIDSRVPRGRRDRRAPGAVRSGQVHARQHAGRGRRACSRQAPCARTAPGGTRPRADSSCCCPDGGVLIDNPGMREAQLWTADEGLAGAFPDIAELAGKCTFSDCRHEAEPGCAVLRSARGRAALG